jgi:uncharacterized protein YndB with AHSA1/START domain
LTIRKSIKVERPPQIAFKVFCEEIGKWWPLKEGFSFGRERAKDIFIEARVGGRFFERFTDGEEFEVGKITAYVPPSVVAFTWRAPEWEASTSVEVRFSADGSGTLIELEHSGWEQGPKMQADGKGYDGGWDLIIERYGKTVGAA